MSVFRPGNTAVITGGASGIGLALAAKCVAYGMRVLVADWDAEALATAPDRAAQPQEGGQPVIAAAAAAAGARGSVIPFQMDVAKLDDWARLRAQVDELGDIHLLALNAGVGGASPWSDPAAFRRILDVNLLGVVHGLATLLPVVQATAAKTTEATGASIVITGSKQGITNPPGTSPAYNASKAAVRSLAEQLAFDLDRQKRPVSVHLLVPGWTLTGLTTTPASGAKPSGAWWPAQVVDYLEPAMAANQFYVLCPDNDVTEAQDRRRVLWSAGDLAERRPPLSRWRPQFKDQVDAWMKE